MFQVHWENRLLEESFQGCYISVDGIDCPIYERYPLDKCLYSRKFKRAGLRYEIEVCATTGEVVWVHGPFQYGSFPDLRIFRLARKCLLQATNEKAIADRGYRDEMCITPDSGSNNAVLNRIRAKGETVNSHFKNVFSFFPIVLDTILPNIAYVSMLSSLFFN